MRGRAWSWLTENEEAPWLPRERGEVGDWWNIVEVIVGIKSQRIREERL